MGHGIADIQLSVRCFPLRIEIRQWRALNNFEAFTAQQQTAVRAILQMYSSVANLTFTEVTETSSDCTATCAMPNPIAVEHRLGLLPEHIGAWAATPGSTTRRTYTTIRSRATTPISR